MLQKFFSSAQLKVSSSLKMDMGQGWESDHMTCINLSCSEVWFGVRVCFQGNMFFSSNQNVGKPEFCLWFRSQGGVQDLNLLLHMVHVLQPLFLLDISVFIAKNGGR